MFNCPTCDKTLRLNAKSCTCGWAETPVAKETKSSLLEHSLDHQCTYRSGGDRCRYPVNFFEPGQTRSMCRYHKKHLGNVEVCDKVTARSWRDSDAEYQERSDKETYGEQRSKLEQYIFDRLHKTVAAQRKAEKVAA